MAKPETSLNVNSIKKSGKYVQFMPKNLASKRSKESERRPLDSVTTPTNRHYALLT